MTDFLNVSIHALNAAVEPLLKNIPEILKRWFFLVAGEKMELQNLLREKTVVCSAKIHLELREPSGNHGEERSTLNQENELKGDGL